MDFGLSHPDGEVGASASGVNDDATGQIAEFGDRVEAGGLRLLAGPEQGLESRADLLHHLLRVVLMIP